MYTASILPRLAAPSQGVRSKIPTQPLHTTTPVLPRPITEAKRRTAVLLGLKRSAFRSSGMWRRVVWYKLADFSEEPTASNLSVSEDGGNSYQIPNYSILHEVVYFRAAETSRTSSAFSLNVTMIMFVITVNKFDIYTWLLIYRVVHAGSNLMRTAWQYPNERTDRLKTTEQWCDWDNNIQITPILISVLNDSEDGMLQYGWSVFCTLSVTLVLLLHCKIS